MIKYYVVKKINFEAGPQIGFLTSFNGKLTENSSFPGYNEFKETTLTSTDDLNRIDFGLNLGAAYDITKNFSVGIRYCLGLNKYNKNSPSNGTDVKNSVLQIGIAYKI